MLLALFSCLWAGAQSSLPTFSTEDNPVWYTVQFKSGSAFVSDQGSGQGLKTVASVSGDAQKFQFIGTQTGFTMKSKSGHYVCINSSSKFATAALKTSAATLKIISGTEDGYWEIQNTAASGQNTMNQWGGTGAGKELGQWTSGDGNNQLYFNEQSYRLPTFSAENEEGTYYYLKFAASNKYIQATGDGELATVVTAADDAGQKWKLVGTQDNFQLVNKAGEYAVVSSTAYSDGVYANNPNPVRASSTPQTGGFSLVENSYAVSSYNIVANSKTSGSTKWGFNQWGGTGGSYIGIWSSMSDQGNAVKFVDPSDITYADYKSTGIEGYAPEHDLTLWYTEPATTAKLYSGGQGYSNWMEYSLPIGNGQFGASLFGGIAKDEIQFNEKTLWSGTNAKSASGGSGYGKYENFGSVYAENLDDTNFGYGSDKTVTNYYRQLDLTTATGKVSFTSPEGVTYTREYIASNPDDVVVAHYTADQSGKISLRFSVTPGNSLKKPTPTYANGEGYFSGKLDLVSFNARFKVVPTGGTMTTTEEGVEVRDADEVLLILAGGTNFDAYSSTYISNTLQLANNVRARINDASAKTWSDLYSAHVADFKSYFDRCQLELDGTENKMTTNKLIDAYNGGKGSQALMLEKLYFAYGRYLEISSSRGVDLPSNLQGIWSNMDNPAWNADIHSNINVQMNYWPAEPTNLSEMHLPFVNYIWNEAVNHDEWTKWAQNSGQSRGWTCYTENNIFGGVSSFMTTYVVANAWYVSHLWQHYRYTLDKEYLKKVFPAMLTASQFWIDRLVLASDGTYECPKEWSPEQGPTEDGVAHAQQLVYECLSNTLSAIDVLGSDAEISAVDLTKLKDRFSKMDKGLATETYTGNWGTGSIASGTKILREWKYSSYTSGSNGHRHMSHLMCMYPFSQVSPNTELWDAAVASMKLRGDGATGWSMGWKINLWARAFDGDHARTILNNALSHSNGGAGVFYNLFDSHAPFQIDGNFGACAGMAEMLVQSNADTIRVLPALPTAWKNGSIKGMKTVNDFTVDVTWKAGKPSLVKITNNQGQSMPLTIPGLQTEGVKVYVDEAADPITLTFDENGSTLLTGKAGTTYVFDYEGTYVPSSIHNAAEASALTITVKAGKVSVSGKEVKNLRVIDLNGRTLKTTTKSSVSVENAGTPAVIVEVTAKDGTVTTQKVAL